LIDVIEAVHGYTLAGYPVIFHKNLAIWCGFLMGFGGLIDMIEAVF